MPHYVKKLGKKNYWHELRSVRVIAPITMTVIFLECWEGVATENLNVNLSLNEKYLPYYKNEISEMKQTKNWL